MFVGGSMIKNSANNTTNDTIFIEKGTFISLMFLKEQKKPEPKSL